MYKFFNFFLKKISPQNSKTLKKCHIKIYDKKYWPKRGAHITLSLTMSTELVVSVLVR